MIRITGGRLKGRVLQIPRGQKTRPTLSRVRQALFNSLQTRIEDARVLDLFAGSGALGIEALSRGARSAIFVESARPALQVLGRNLRELEIESPDPARVLGVPAETAQRRLLDLGEKFDLIFIDPPYREGHESRLLTEWPWEQLLVPDGWLILEWSSQAVAGGALPEKLPFLVKIREKAYGETVLTTYTAGAHEGDLSR